MRRLPLVLLLVLSACGDDSTSSPPDASLTDATLPDAGADAGAGSTLPGDDAEALLTPFVESGWLMSVSGALIEGDQVEYFAVGEIEAGGALPDPDTVYEMGSITKTFTALLLADAAERGEVTLDTPLQDLLPGTTIPVQGMPITLEHMSTHSSGLPRLPDNMPSADPLDPYADYTVALLYEFFESHALARAPATSFEYSNLAVGALGHALAVQAGTDYESLVNERVTTPLGLGDTAITLSPSMQERVAPGHTGDLVPTPNSAFTDATVAAGGLRTTARDLASYARAWMDPDSPLAAAMAHCTTGRFDASSTTRVGLNWFLLDGDTLLFHNGGTGGYRAFLLMEPANERGAVLLFNASTYPTDALGFAVFDLLRGLEPRLPDLPEEIAVDPAVLTDYVGTYQFVFPFAGVQAEVTVDGGLLYGSVDGGPRGRQYPEADDVFFVRRDGTQITYQRDAMGVVTGLLARFVGGGTAAANKI